MARKAILIRKKIFLAKSLTKLARLDTLVNALEKRKQRERAEPRKKNTFESRIYKLLVKKLNEESTVKLMTQKIT
ncbi:hypothetical protein PL9631_700030 [Planktothrix paucivesiculata PCC 9631]|uniref:Uncharacterized protein n=1 Tax=Planktothrix paucivesiculata PCC 9631 TaxID=671071 RepID=A0A7Z9E307_9CYAN|nr:hypothetical protein PL9631_700030 [Planktothrix paucivesiculata PCC 9631]